MIVNASVAVKPKILLIIALSPIGGLYARVSSFLSYPYFYYTKSYRMACKPIEYQRRYN